MSERLKSDVISEFNTLVQESKNKRDTMESLLKEADKATQDLLHSIEFSDNSSERSKCATQLKWVRKDRRYYKDILEEYELLADYSQEFDKAVKKLSELLGKMRKVEAYHKDRKYYPRVIK